MSAPRDGGPAFPVWDEMHGEIVAGMSLRDWYAGQALVGLLAARGESNAFAAASEYANYALDIADVMLAERTKP